MNKKTLFFILLFFSCVFFLFSEESGIVNIDAQGNEVIFFIDDSELKDISDSQKEIILNSIRNFSNVKFPVIFSSDNVFEFLVSGSKGNSFFNGLKGLSEKNNFSSSVIDIEESDVGDISIEDGDFNSSMSGKESSKKNVFKHSKEDKIKKEKERIYKREKFYSKIHKTDNPYLKDLENKSSIVDDVVEDKEDLEVVNKDDSQVFSDFKDYMNKSVSDDTVSSVEGSLDYKITTIIYFKLLGFEKSEVEEKKNLVKIKLNFFILDLNGKKSISKDVYVLGFSDDVEKAFLEAVSSIEKQLQAEISNVFNIPGSPYIINFITDEKVVLGVGKNSGSFSGALFSVKRRFVDENGLVVDKTIGEIFVEKAEDDFSYGYILHSKEKILLGDEVFLISKAGVLQDFYTGVFLDVITKKPVFNSKNDYVLGQVQRNSYALADWSGGFKLCVFREMPTIKPVFALDFLGGIDGQFDLRGVYKNNLITSLMAGVEVDWMVHKFIISPVLMLGFGFADNSYIDNSVVVSTVNSWFALSAGARFSYRILEGFGVSLGLDYASWIGLLTPVDKASGNPKVSFFDKFSNINSFKPDNYSGVKISLGLFVFY